MNELTICRKQIRQLRNAIVNNLDDKFNPINERLDIDLNNQLEKEKLRLKNLTSSNDEKSLSNMYLKSYA